VTVDDGIRKQAGVHHLDQVFVLKIPIDRHDGYRLQALGHGSHRDGKRADRRAKLNGFPDFSVLK
jgi:hypothetical protein